MKKLVLALVLALGLTGCASIQGAFQAGQLLTASYTNPVTREMLYNAENALIVAFAGLNAYKKSCLAGAAEANCRGNIARIQVYTRQIPPLLTQLRKFVKANDQVNAVIVYNEVVDLIARFKAVAVEAGVPVGG
jgi:uncharacterized protein YceK